MYRHRIAVAEKKRVEGILIDKEEHTIMTYTMPGEDMTHEGTWLTWPHRYTYGIGYPHEIEGIWVEMVMALHTGEKIHIITYNKSEQTRITRLLTDSAVDLRQIDFVLAQSDDVWARDTGPMFVFDKNNKLVIADFAFDGWGEKAPYKKDNQIPAAVSKEKSFPLTAIPDLVLEGGAVELDGSGTLMAAKSSVCSKNRNSQLTLRQVEEYLSKYLGVVNFIWLEGVTDEEITDAHIDGMARFYNHHTILTVSVEDFPELYENINMNDYNRMKRAKNANGHAYELVELPLTKKNVDGLNYKGSYLNYYIGNEVVLVPIYKDENDVTALEIIAGLYPTRKMVPIVVNDLFQYGGMLHCVTQQQPQSPVRCNDFPSPYALQNNKIFSTVTP